MPKYLRCNKDATHSSFKGLQHVCCEYVVDLDASGQAIGRKFSATLHDLSDPDDQGIACAACHSIAWTPLQSISFVPAAGLVLLCNFSTGFQAPEMIKIRPVVVISERDRNRDTCIVVPVSSVLPRDARAVFVALDSNKYAFFQKPDNWAKCETINAVRVQRLFRLRDPATGRGIDSRQTMIDPADLKLVREGVSRVIGLP